MTGERPASADRQVSVGGRSLTLRYSLKAFAALQDHFEAKSINGVVAKLNALGEDLAVDDLVALFHAGLRSHHPEITRADTLNLLDELGPQAIGGEIMQALSAAVDSGGEGAAGANGQATPRRPAESRPSTRSSRKRAH